MMTFAWSGSLVIMSIRGLLRSLASSAAMPVILSVAVSLGSRTCFESVTFRPVVKSCMEVILSVVLPIF